jgi:hypothetical protein
MHEMDVLDNESFTPKQIAENILESLHEKLKDEFRVVPESFTERHNRQTNVKAFIQHIRDTMIIEKGRTKLTFITPHTRKHGGPTTLLTTANELSKRGYDVNMVSIYDDNIKMSLLKMAEVPIYYNKKYLQDADIVFVPSDSDQHALVETLNAKKIMFKLSHNERFRILEQQGIDADYDRIITSSNWLATACDMPLDGWEHKRKHATPVGWYNYGFNEFKAHPLRRSYNKLGQTPVCIAGLLHAHPLKGTQTMIDVFTLLHKKYGDQVKLVAIGEGKYNIPNYIQPMLNLPRSGIATLFKKYVDVWLGCSHTEGLGRLGLEAMSAGAAC